MVRLRANPLEALTVQLFWIYQRLDQLEPDIVPRPPTDPRVALITDRDLSHEVDFILDWTVNDYLSTSFVAAFLVPLKGGVQALGNDGTWGQFMIATSVRF